MEEPLQGALGRFSKNVDEDAQKPNSNNATITDAYYKLARPGTLWDVLEDRPLAIDGGKERVKKMDTSIPDVVAGQNENEDASSVMGDSQSTTYLPDYPSLHVHSHKKENASDFEKLKIEQIAFEI